MRKKFTRDVKSQTFNLRLSAKDRERLLFIMQETELPAAAVVRALIRERAERVDGAEVAEVVEASWWGK